MADAAGDFTFPELYNWQPFFTLQKHAASAEKQYEVWSQLVRDYCRHHKIFSLNLDEASRSKLFSNESIGRSLNTQSIERLISQLVAEGYAEWDTPEGGSKEKCFVYWRKPTEWADMIQKHVADNGFSDTVFTLYEIMKGDFGSGSPIADIDEAVLKRALTVLQKRGMATIIEPDEDDDEDDMTGVKFHAESFVK